MNFTDLIAAVSTDVNFVSCACSASTKFYVFCVMIRACYALYYLTILTSMVVEVVNERKKKRREEIKKIWEQGVITNFFWQWHYRRSRRISSGSFTDH